MQGHTAESSSPERDPGAVAAPGVGVRPGVGTPDSVRALQRAAGNRATRAVLARHGGGRTADAPSDHSVPYPTPTHPLELAIKKKFGDRASVGLKLTISARNQRTMTESTTAGGAGVAGFWENKAMLERAGGKTAAKIQDALAKGDWVGEIIPGLKVKFGAKLLEAQVAKAADEAELALIAVTFAFEGDITKWFLDALEVPERDRSGAKVTVSGEAKIYPRLADLARLRDMARAKWGMSRSSSAIRRAAERAKAIDAKLGAAGREVEALTRKAEAFAGFGKRQRAKYGSRQAYDAAEQATKDRLTAAIDRQTALEAEKAALKATIKAETKLFEKSSSVMARAAAGLKSKAGGLIGKALATQAGKHAARMLAHAIPILNAIAIAWDIYEVVSFLRKVDWRSLWKAIKAGELGGGGGEGDGEAGSPGATGPAQPALSGSAQAVAEALERSGAPLPGDQLWQLGEAVPDDLTAEQLEELTERLEALPAAPGEGDPYELIGIVQDEAEKVRRGHDAESELTWIDGEFRAEHSSGAPERVLAHEAAAEEERVSAGAELMDPYRYLKDDPATGRLVADPVAIRRATGGRIEFAGGARVRIAGVEVKQLPHRPLQQLLLDLRVVVERPGRPLWDGFKAGDRALLDLGGVAYDPSTGKRGRYSVGPGRPADEL